jgi:hypothetical protein
MLVVEGGIEPDYFLDYMCDWELDASLKSLERQRRERWEQCRLSCFYTVASFGGKVKKPQDLWEFSWEKSVAHKEHAPIVAATKEEMLAMINEFENQLKNK